MWLHEQEHHLLLVDCGVGLITNRVVVLDCALVELDELGELDSTLIDPELLHDDILLEITWQVPLLSSELSQALRLGERATGNEGLGVRPLATVALQV